MEHAECSICFDPLIARPCGILKTNRNSRVCKHFYHSDCIEDYIEVNSGAGTSTSTSATCPMCRRSFHHLDILPDPSTNPKGWFDVCDEDNNGTLSSSEVLDGLKATLNLDWRAIERDMDSMWDTHWDVNGDNMIDYNEFLTNLLPYILQHYPSAITTTTSTSTSTAGSSGSGSSSVFDDFGFNVTEARAIGNIPPIAHKPRLWFQYWDEDNSDELSKEEVLRAIIKTFKLDINTATGTATGTGTATATGTGTTNAVDTTAAALHNFHRKCSSIISTLDAIWPMFDHDGSGDIDIDEFVQSDGLCDTILATLQYS
jgi:hypothetical protein